jgi:lysophospholipase L1-like esterase
MAQEATRPRGRGWLVKAAHVAAMIWVQIGVALLLLWVVSAAAGAVVKRIRHAHDVIPSPEEAYHGQPWTHEYFRSLNRVHMRWYPYAYWKAKPMHSRYLNIDADGNRVTWRPNQSGANRPVVRLFMMGGSTLWGTGVRDDHTLASLLAKHFAANPGYDLEITNLGQIGYVTTQEVILLYELLRRGQRPDVVTFYDGVNEAFTGYQNGMAGLTQSEFFRAQEFSMLSSSWGRKNLYRAALRMALMNTGLADLIKHLSGKDDPNLLPHQIQPFAMLSYLAPAQDFEGTEAVERDVVDIYLFNVRMARTLGQEFKFQSLFYWQPTVFSKNRLAPFERRLLPGDPMRAEFFKGTYKRLAAAAADNGIIDLSGILNNRTQDDFIDPYHLNEAANEIIAARMAADLAPILERIAQQKAGTTSRSVSQRRLPASVSGAAG